MFSLVAMILGLGLVPTGTPATLPAVPAQKLAPAATTSTGPVAPLCPPLVLDPAVQFAPGESLKFKLDVFGADVGTMELTTEVPAREDRDQAVLQARGKTSTSAFLSSAAGANYAGRGVVLLGPNLTPLRWHEEVDDADNHFMHEFDLPPAPMQAVHATRNGNPVPLTLAMTPSARDLISAMLAVRAIPLTAKPDAVCLEVYAGRRMWKLAGGPTVKESIDTPFGKLDTLRIELTSTRVDDPKVTRKAQFWITTDARRLPVVALAEVRGKFIRATLVKADEPKRRRK